MDEQLKQINRSKIWLYLVFLIGSALGGYFGNQINWGDYQVSWENFSTFYPLITGFGGGIALIGLFYSLFGPRSSLNSNPILSSTKSLSDKPTNSLNSEKKTEIRSSNSLPVSNNTVSTTSNPTSLKPTSTPDPKPITAPTLNRVSTSNLDTIRTSIALPSPKSSTNNAPKSNLDSIEFLEKVIKLGELAKQSHELVENEVDLSKKEKTRLLLKRDEFKRLYHSMKDTNYDCF